MECRSSFVVETPPSEYEDYVSFKGWGSSGRPSENGEHQAVMRLARKPAGYSHLDIGFGSGGLLDWTRANHGATTYGAELIPELRESAAARGHQIVDTDLSLCDRCFDVITAIDVLEHLSVSQCREMMRQVARLLKPDGVFLARFPNGQSPFSGAFQNGDVTHVRALTGTSLRQIAEPLGLRLEMEANFRPLPPGWRGLRRLMVHVARDVIEGLLGFSYYGRRVPMDANLVVVLRPSPSQDAI